MATWPEGAIVATLVVPGMTAPATLAVPPPSLQASETCASNKVAPGGTVKCEATVHNLGHDQVDLTEFSLQGASSAVSGPGGVSGAPPAVLAAGEANASTYSFKVSAHAKAPSAVSITLRASGVGETSGLPTTSTRSVSIAVLATGAKPH